ncbi:MAG: hypothetical protein ACLTNR_10670 [Coprococcus sp.]
MGYFRSDEHVRVVGSVDELLQLLKTLFSGCICVNDNECNIKILFKSAEIWLENKDNYTDVQLKKMIKENESSLEIICESEGRNTIDPIDTYLVQLLVNEFPFLKLNGETTGCSYSIPCAVGYRTDNGKLYTTIFPESRCIDVMLRETNYLDYMERILPYDEFCNLFCVDKSKFSEKDLECLYRHSIDLAEEDYFYVDQEATTYLIFYGKTSEYINECFPDIGYERFIEICNYGTEIGEKKYKQIIKLIKAMGVIDPLEFGKRKFMPDMYCEDLFDENPNDTASIIESKVFMKDSFFPEADRNYEYKDIDESFDIYMPKKYIKQDYSADESEIAAVIYNIVMAQSPIHIDLVCDQVAPLCEIKEKVLKIINKFALFDRWEVRGRFLWRVDGSEVVPRIPITEEDARPFDYIEIDELAAAMLVVLKRNKYIRKAHLYEMLASLYKTKVCESRLDCVFSLLYRNKAIKELEGKVYACNTK